MTPYVKEYPPAGPGGSKKARVGDSAVAQGDGGGGIDELGFEADFLPCFDGDGPGSMSATCRAPVAAEKPGE